MPLQNAFKPYMFVQLNKVFDTNGQIDLEALDFNEPKVIQSS